MLRGNYMKNLILCCAAVAIFASSPLFAQNACYNNNCGVYYSENYATGDCSSGSCASNYDPNAFHRTAIYPTGNLRYTLKNQGVEKSRFYIKARVYGKVYTVPVINGNMPEVSVVGNNELILNYANKISYSNEWGGEIVEYTSKASLDLNKKAPAVKALEKQENVINDKAPLGIKLIEEDVSKVKKEDGPKSITPPSDEEIDNLLRRPSKVVK